MLDELKENFDPEKLFNLYLELESSWKINRYLENIGIVNPYTGNKYTPETIRRTIWKWILDNPEKSLTVLRDRELLKKNGKEIDDLDWEEFLVEKAYSLYVKIGVTKSRFDRWLRKNNLYDKYKDYGRIRSRDLETIQK